MNLVYDYLPETEEEVRNTACKANKDKKKETTAKTAEAPKADAAKAKKN